MLESVHGLISTPPLVGSDVSKALPNIIRSSVLDSVFTIKRKIILRSQVHFTFGFVISVTGECPTNGLNNYIKIVVCRNKVGISVIPLSQKFKEWLK